VKSFWTAAPMTAEGPRKGEPSKRTMRNGFPTQPAPLVRGSSRRIMSMRFRPAHIRVINRRASSWAVIGPAVQAGNSRLTSRNVFPLRRPSGLVAVPEQCSRARVRFAAAYGAPLPAPRRSGQEIMRWAAPAGTLTPSLRNKKGKIEKTNCQGLTGRSISVLLRA
jgi:hypothetical protein